MRCFIGIFFATETAREIARVEENLNKYSFTGKLTELEQIHLTLKFLGEVNETTLELLRNRLRTIRFPSFIARLGEIGTFSSHGMPRLVWIKLLGEPIWTLQKEIDRVLADLFAPEARFMSHITIARIKYVRDSADFKNYVGHIHVRPLPVAVGSFSLITSELHPLGPTYTVVEDFTLSSEVDSF